MNNTDDVSPNICYDTEKDFFNPRTKASGRERRRFMRYREVRDHYGTPPKNASEKYIVKLGTLRFTQLIRRLKQAARLASHFKHLSERTKSPYMQPKLRALHDNALMSLCHIKSEIEIRHNVS